MTGRGGVMMATSWLTLAGKEPSNNPTADEFTDDLVYMSGLKREQDTKNPGNIY